jgi:hypothetical protein
VGSQAGKHIRQGDRQDRDILDVWHRCAAVDIQRGLHCRQAVKNKTYRHKVCKTGRERLKQENRHEERKAG